MRNDWSRSIGVLAAAATLVIMTQLPRTGTAATAAEPHGISGREVAAAAPAPGRPSSAAMDDISVTTGVTSTSDSTLATPDSIPETSDAASTKAPTDESVSQDFITAPEPAMNASLPSLGDDALPTALDGSTNPYINVGVQESGIGGGTNAGMRAYVPPTSTKDKTHEEKAREEGAQLMGVLGADIFNMQVNVSTPPDTDVAEVIRLLAERARINFVYGAGVITEKVTLNLRDVPLGVALQSILASQDLALVREGSNVFRIVRRKDIQQSTIETRTIYIKLNWVTAASLEETLKDFGQGGGSTNVNSVKSSKESNTLIITDTPTNVALLRDIVAQLDVPEKQVMIEARMVEMFIDNGRSLGSDIQVEKRDGSGNSRAVGTLTGNKAGSETSMKPIFGDGGKITGYESVVTAIPAKAVDALATSLLVGPTAAGSIDFGGVVSIFGKEFDIAATLDALVTRRVANILANPRVITLNNQEAVIDIQREIPYLEAQQGVSQGVVTASVKFKDAGIMLTVLPTITNNGFVRMRLLPEQKILAGNFIDPVGNAIPIIDRRRAVTNVIVKDEDTVVLGGLREITSSEQKRMFPWLAQAPILGSFFKNSVKAHRKNDLMIFVTPHIVKAPELTPAEAYKVSRIDAHWDLPDYFFDDSVEARESRHRGELDHNAQSYYKNSLKLPPLSQPCPPGSMAEEFPTPKGE